jgi:hypothetical protein
LMLHNEASCFLFGTTFQWFKLRLCVTQLERENDHGGSVDLTNGRGLCQVIITSDNCANQGAVGSPHS